MRELLQRYRTHIVLSLYVFAAVIVFFYNIQLSPMRDWDEGIYGTIALEMGGVPRLTPTLFGEPWFEKPPLGLWLHTIGMRLFGTDVFGLRVMGAMASVLAATLFFLIARHFFGFIHGIIAGVFFITSPLLLHAHMVQSGDFEPYFLCSVLFAVYMYVRGWDDRRYFVLASIGFGLAFLCRGTIALLPLSACVLHFLFCGMWREPQTLRVVFISLGAFLVTVVPWHAYMIWQHGQAFLDVYAGTHFVHRVLEPVQGFGSIYTYIIYAVIKLSLPLTVLYLCAYFFGWVLWFRLREKHILLILVWLTVCGVGLLYTATKLYWYSMMMIAPAIFIFCLAFVFPLFTFVKTRKLSLRVLVSMVACVMTIVATGNNMAVFYTQTPTTLQRAVQGASILHSNASSVIFYKTHAWFEDRPLPSAAFLAAATFPGVEYTSVSSVDLLLETLWTSPKTIVFTDAAYAHELISVVPDLETALYGDIVVLTQAMHK